MFGGGGTCIGGSAEAVKGVTRGFLGRPKKRSFRVSEATIAGLKISENRGRDDPAGVKRRTQCFRTLRTELNIHELIEERLLSPREAARRGSRCRPESYQEHHIADVIARELRTLAKSDEKWGAKFKVFKESIEHHIQEEEGKMFRTARAVLSRDELLDLGARMRALRAELEG